jgi:hypothetical protein
MRRLGLAVLFGTLVMPLQAKDVEITGGTQQQFNSIAEDLVATIDYKALGPAEATGIAGFGVGIVASYVPVGNKSNWSAVTSESFSGLGLLGLQVTKGLPLGIDVGVFYTAVPDTNVKVYGGKLRYAILEGSTLSPALALGVSWVTTRGIDTFDLESKSVDLALSKGLTLITPYAGVGYVFGSADPDPSTGFNEAKVEDTKAYVGARISLGLLEFTPEVGWVGDNITYSLRTGFSFSL